MLSNLEKSSCSKSRFESQFTIHERASDAVESEEMATALNIGVAKAYAEKFNADMQKLISANDPQALSQSVAQATLK